MKFSVLAMVVGLIVASSVLAAGGENPLPPPQVRKIQEVLKSQGLYRTGSVDGIYGPLTQAAVEAFQRAHSLAATGQIDRQTASAMGLSEVQESASTGTSSRTSNQTAMIKVPSPPEPSSKAEPTANPKPTFNAETATKAKSISKAEMAPNNQVASNSEAAAKSEPAANPQPAPKVEAAAAPGPVLNPKFTSEPEPGPTNQAAVKTAAAAKPEPASSPKPAPNSKSPEQTASETGAASMSRSASNTKEVSKAAAASKTEAASMNAPGASYPARAEPSVESEPLNRPALKGISAGTVLQEAEKGASAASSAGTTIGSDAAAINYPTVASAFASSDGIAVPDVADQSPGKERLTNVYERAELFTGSGEVRVKRLVGIGVFNTADERLGTIRDVLLTPGGEPQVILEAAGREVAVPWSKLKFALPGDELHGQVVLPGMTQHALEQLPELGPQNRHDSG